MDNDPFYLFLPHFISRDFITLLFPLPSLVLPKRTETVVRGMQNFYHQLVILELRLSLVCDAIKVFLTLNDRNQLGCRSSGGGARLPTTAAAGQKVRIVAEPGAQERGPVPGNAPSISRPCFRRRSIERNTCFVGTATKDISIVIFYRWTRNGFFRALIDCYDS